MTFTPSVELSLVLVPRLVRRPPVACKALIQSVVCRSCAVTEWLRTPLDGSGYHKGPSALRRKPGLQGTQGYWMGQDAKIPCRVRIPAGSQAVSRMKEHLQSYSEGFLALSPRAVPHGQSPALHLSALQTPSTATMATASSPFLAASSRMTSRFKSVPNAFAFG